MADLQNESFGIASKVEHGTKAAEQTLFGAVRNLNEISWRIHAQLFGELPKGEGTDKPMPSDNVRQIKNIINEITDRLEHCSETLGLLGE